MDRLVGIAALAEGDAAERRQQAVVRRDVAPVAAHAVGRHPGVHQARMDVGQGRGVEVQRLQPPGRIAEQSHVGAGDQFARGSQALRRVQIEGHHLLVAVPGLVARMFSNRRSLGWRSTLTTPRREIAQEHAMGPETLAEIGDAQPW